MFDAQARCETRAQAYFGNRRREGTQATILPSLARARETRPSMTSSMPTLMQRILYTLIYLYPPLHPSFFFFFLVLLIRVPFHSLFLCSPILSLSGLSFHASPCVNSQLFSLLFNTGRAPTHKPQHGSINLAPTVFAAPHSCICSCSFIHRFWTTNPSFYV
jgi:hypothetical protein